MNKYLNELDAKRFLSSYGVPMAKSRKAADKEELLKVLEEMEFPIAMKVLSSEILHKTEAGCVFLGVKKEEAEEVFDRILSNAGKYALDAAVDGVLLQEMAPSGLEVIIGMNKDLQFGPVLMVGMGGIYVEVFKDVALRLLPVTEDEVSRMLKETRLYSIIQGARGTRYDESELVKTLLKVAKLVQEHPEVEEIDINPLFLYEEGKGGKGVDALIRVEE